MFIRQVDRIVMLVAIDTAEQGIVAWRRVAIHALIPFAFMFAAIDREVLPVMIPGGRGPSRGRVAGFTIRGEPDLFVVRIIGAIIIRTVAAKAGIRRVVIIPVVTGRAIVGDARMSAGQWPEVIVNGESGGHPIGVSSVTQGTIRG